MKEALRVRQSDADLIPSDRKLLRLNGVVVSVAETPER
jgi:hypothetical protein